MKSTVSIYLENKTFIIISVHTVCQNQRFVNMFWSEMMARMNQQPKIVKDWVCFTRFIALDEPPTFLGDGPKHTLFKIFEMSRT